MIGSNSKFRDEWLEGAARAFFVCAYADFVDEANSTDNDLNHEERMARINLPRPKAGKGEDWMNFAPHTPPNAYALAGQLWNKLECHNKCSVYVLANRAAQADKPCRSCKGSSVMTISKNGDAYNSDCTACDGRGYTKEIDANKFGHYLAMQAMGHGVSWFDDHKKFVIDIPHLEVSQCDFSDEAYGL